MPEHAELALLGFAIPYSLNRPIDAQELLVLRDDFNQRLAALIKKYEILEESMKFAFEQTPFKRVSPRDVGDSRSVL
jgi:hypothetical protein